MMKGNSPLGRMISGNAPITESAAVSSLFGNAPAPITNKERDKKKKLAKLARKERQKQRKRKK
jgi:signal recognition particle subunit SRP54